MTIYAGCDYCEWQDTELTLDAAKESAYNHGCENPQPYILQEWSDLGEMERDMQ